MYLCMCVPFAVIICECYDLLCLVADYEKRVKELQAEVSRTVHVDLGVH